MLVGGSLMGKELFNLARPHSNLRAVVGSAHIAPINDWGAHGVVVTLESGSSFRLENFKKRDEAERYAAEVNQRKPT